MRPRVRTSRSRRQWPDHRRGTGILQRSGREECVSRGNILVEPGAQGSRLRRYCEDVFGAAHRKGGDVRTAAFRAGGRSPSLSPFRSKAILRRRSGVPHVRRAITRPGLGRSASGQLGPASASTPPLTLRSQAMRLPPAARVPPRRAAMVAVTNEGGLMEPLTKIELDTCKWLGALAIACTVAAELLSLADEAKPSAETFAGREMQCRSRNLSRSR